MFHSPSNPAGLYSEVSVDTGVNSATPHQLIDMLFAKAQEQLGVARHAMSDGDRAAKGEAITRVIRIIDEGLRASLNYDAGEIAHNLGNLYGYMMERLLHANQADSAQALDEGSALMAQIHDAWTQIGEQVGASGSAGAKS